MLRIQSEELLKLVEDRDRGFAKFLLLGRLLALFQKLRHRHACKRLCRKAVAGPTDQGVKYIDVRDRQLLPTGNAGAHPRDGKHLELFAFEQRFQPCVN